MKPLKEPIHTEPQNRFTLQDHKTIPAFEPNLGGPWCKSTCLDKEFAANDWALQRLGQGVSGLLFYLTDEHYLPRILKDIQLEYINLGLVIEGSGPAVMEALLHHAHNEIIPASKLRGFINIDPVEIAARTGVWHEEKMYELGELTRLAPKGMKFMCANANFYGACGASAATQLGLAAAHLDFYSPPSAKWASSSMLGSTHRRYLHVRRNREAPRPSNVVEAAVGRL